MAEITRQDIISDEALMAPLILAKNLMEPVAALDALIKKGMEHNKVIGAAESTTTLRKETEALTAEQKELIKIQNQISVATAKNNADYRIYQQILSATKKEIKEKTALGDKEATSINRQNASLIELRAALDKNRIAFSSLRTEEERTSKEGKALLAVIHQQDAAVKELSADIGKHQDKVGDYEGAMRKLKNELQKSKDEMVAIAGTLGTGSKEFIAAAEKTGQLKDEIQDMNDAAKAVSGGPFENFGSALGNVGSKLRNLDFKGALGAAKQFAAVSKQMTFKEAIGGASSFGKTMATMGKALLTNPFVLIAAIAIAIGVAIFELRNKIKPLTIAFDAMGQAIDFVVQIGKDFLDFLGLSSFAADEKAAAVVEASEKEIDAIKERYDNEIAIAEAAGKTTVDLERKKWEEVKAEANGAYTEMINMKERSNGKLEDEDEQHLQNAMKSIIEANTQLQIIDNKETVRKQKQADDEAKIEQKRLDDAAKKRQQAILKEKGDFFQLNQFRINILIQQNQLILENQEKGEAERLVAAERAQKLRENLAKLEFTNAMQQANLTTSGRTLIAEQLQAKLNDIELQGTNERKRINEDETQRILEEHNKRIESANKEVSQKVLIAEQGAILAIDAIKKEVLQGTKTREQGAKEIEQVQKETSRNVIDVNIKALEKIIATEQLTAEERAKIDEKLFDLRSELINKQFEMIEVGGQTNLEKTQEQLDNILGIYQNFAGSASALFNSLTEGRLQNIQMEQDALAAQMEQELLAAGENEEAKSEIRNRFAREQAALEKQKLAAQRRAAVFDKGISAIQAEIATAVAVTKAGVITPLAIATGIAGAIQVAAILAKPIPAFAEGGEHKGGLVVVGEKGPERIDVPGRQPFLSPGTTTLMNLPANTMITDHEATMRQLAAGQLKYSDSYDRSIAKDYGREIVKGFKSLEHTIRNKTEVHWNMSKGDIKRAYKNAQTMTYFLDNYYR